MNRCPSCGHDNPDAARHCAECGAQLLDPGESRERKLVTVLFCDLVDFTARFDRADPEDVKAALSPYHALVRREIERFGGTVEKFIGDAVVGVYGAPVSHEDDARRALWSALRIPPAIDDLNESLPDVELAVRIGIDTGQAVVTIHGDHRTQGMVTGDVVNTASRIQAVAPTGGVIVGEATHRLTEELFEFERLDPVRVKGKARPLHLWRARSARSRFGVEPERPAAVPFIGREDELEVLKRTFARAARTPSVQLVTLTGEPGVGKTRLVREFFRYIDDLEDLVFWRQGRCLPYGEGVTFWALGEIVKAQAGILESDGPEEADARLSAATAALVDEDAEREWLTGRLAPLVGLQPPEGAVERSESFSAWRRFLEAMASTFPLVVVIEDLHWADPALLEFVEHVTDWSTDVPMLVLCTSRPELYERHPGWGGGKRNFTAISLPPLPAVEATELVTALAARADLPEHDLVAVLERSGGNPLFAEELVRMRRDLAGGGDGLPDGTASEEAFPETLQAIIAARLDTLPPEFKALVQDAAVVGRVFWSGAVAAIGGLDPVDAEDRLHELTLRELVRPVRVSSVRDQVEYSFWHVLIRDVAYSEIPRADRASKHLATAEWLEDLGGERVADHAEQLAHHYERALAFARMAGLRDELPAIEARARSAFEMAGDRAMALELTRAEEFFRRALELAPPGEAERPGLLARAAEAAAGAGRFEEAKAGFDEAIAEFRSQGRPVGEGDAMVRLANILWAGGEAERSRMLLDAALELLQGQPEGPELANCYAEIASERLAAGRLEEVREWADRALELAKRLGAEALEPRPLGFRGMARSYLGDLDGVDDVRTALEISLEHGLSRESARNLAILADLQWVGEGPAAAAEACEEGATLAERRGVSDMAAWCRCSSIGPLFELGRWDELLEVGGELVEWSRARGGGYLAAMVEPWMARVLAVRGLGDNAAVLVEDFLPSAREIGDPQMVVTALVAAAQAERLRGAPDRAVALVDELLRTGPGGEWYRAHHLAELVRTCVAAGRLDTATSLVGATAPAAPRRRLSVLSSRAMLAEADGQVAEAARLWVEAAGGWGSYGHVLERAWALLGASRCLGPDDPAGAEHVHAAADLFAGLGAPDVVTGAGTVGAADRPTALS